MIFEIRTKNNIRRNTWDGISFEVITCDENDESFGIYDIRNLYKVQGIKQSLYCFTFL